MLNLQYLTSYVFEFFIGLLKHKEVEIGPPRKKCEGKKPMLQISKSDIEIQSRKPHQPHQEHNEVLPLIKATRDKHIAALDNVDVQGNFETNVTKWKRILIQDTNRLEQFHL